MASHTSEDVLQPIDFASAVAAMHSRGELRFSEASISPQLHTYRLGDLAQGLREGQSERHGYLLDADLLIRHASGTLYQEAHKQLMSPARITRQTELAFAEVLPSLTRVHTGQHRAIFTTLRPRLRTHSRSALAS